MQKRFVINVCGAISEFNSVEDLKPGDFVIVENGGNFVGEVLSVVKNASDDELDMVLRFASEGELKKWEENKKSSKAIFKKAKKMCRDFNDSMKLIGAEYSLDKQKLVLTFSSEERIDFRDLVKTLASTFKTRIELKQIGARDEVRLIGGLGPCGLKCCCHRCLSEIPFVGIKMAKNQNLSLSPQKINGLCGKIMCCVSYENQFYAEVQAQMPKINSFVKTKFGKGQVVGCDLLKKQVSVKTGSEAEGFSTQIYNLDEISFEKNKDSKPNA